MQRFLYLILRFLADITLFRYFCKKKQFIEMNPIVEMRLREVERMYHLNESKKKRDALIAKQIGERRKNVSIANIRRKAYEDMTPDELNEALSRYMMDALERGMDPEDVKPMVVAMKLAVVQGRKMRMTNEQREEMRRRKREQQEKEERVKEEMKKPILRIMDAEM